MQNESSKNYQKFLLFLLSPKSYKTNISSKKTSLSKQNALRELYNEIRSDLNLLNSIYIHDSMNDFDHDSLLRQLLERYQPYEEVLGRILCLFYKAMEDEKNEPNGVLHDKFRMALNTDFRLLYKIKKATGLINDICKALFNSSTESVEYGLFKSVLNLKTQDPKEVLQRALGPVSDLPGLWENNMVMISKDPYEPIGAMCRFWNPKLPIVVFSPFYGNYISSLTLVHELGHLVHYKHHLSMDQTKFEGIYEEFFAFVFELCWLLKNPWRIPKVLLQKIFWQRIWFITVRQFQLFNFELLNLKSSSKEILSLNLLKKNWQHTSTDILGILTPKSKWYENSWTQIAQIINLPFRSLDYTVSALLAYYYIHKKGGLDKAILQAKNTEELLKEMGLSSLEEGIERVISILSPSMPTL